MGSEDDDGYPQDGEGPVRPAEVSDFEMAAYAVTNEEFAAFVKETGYRTDAERIGWSFVFHLLVHSRARPFVMDAWLPAAPWWIAVQGASWAAPEGPGSSLDARGRHPVVHVSPRDADAFCAWAGVRLPSEPEWEYAARGGLVGARFPWGDDLTPMGRHRCNVWQGAFPHRNTAEDGWLGTAPVDTYAANGYGLYNVAGNVWEILADSWRTGAVGVPAPSQRVIKGGSYLCHASYCNRYRVAARTYTDLDSSSGNTGFRVAR